MNAATGRFSISMRQTVFFYDPSRQYTSKLASQSDEWSGLLCIMYGTLRCQLCEGVAHEVDHSRRASHRGGRVSISNKYQTVCRAAFDFQQISRSATDRSIFVEIETVPKSGEARRLDSTPCAAIRTTHTIERRYITLKNPLQSLLFETSFDVCCPLGRVAQVPWHT